MELRSRSINNSPMLGGLAGRVADFVCKSDEIHVWIADLAAAAADLSELAGVLSPDEQKRARAFHFSRDREHYVAARAILRGLLAQYLKTVPSEVRFSYEQYGKPNIHDMPASQDLSFNVSHSHGLAFYAIARGRAVGVDVEFMREDFATMEIAERFFSAKEVLALRETPVSLQTKTFFSCWTRKEAYIKALGEGLSHPLDTFTVTGLAPHSILLLTSDDACPSQWSIADLSVRDDYMAALAVEGEMPLVSQWDWNTQGKQFINWT